MDIGEENKNKLLFKEFQKILALIDRDLSEKSAKIDQVRQLIGSVNSKATKLIFKQVEDELALAKKNLPLFYEFFRHMNDLHIKYDAIIDDCSLPHSNDSLSLNAPTSTSNAHQIQTSNNKDNTSQSAILKTPIKDITELHGYASPILPKNTNTNSPKLTPRKASIPKRRNLTSEAQILDSSEPHSLAGEDSHRIKGDTIVEELINYPVLHEKLAESINRVFNGENEMYSDMLDPLQSISDTSEDGPSPTLPFSEEENHVEANEVQLPETAIEDILNGLENDPAFSDFLTICSTKQEYLHGGSSPLTCSSASLNTPTSSEITFKSPLSTPIKCYSRVVKDLMKDLKTPEKKEAPSSPLSTAIESINDSSFNLSNSSSPVTLPMLSFSSTDTASTASLVTPTLTNNSLISLGSENSTLDNLSSNIPISSLPLSIPLSSSQFTFLINNNQGNKFTSQLKKTSLRGKKLNLGRIESSNLAGLKRKQIEMNGAPLRKIAPKLEKLQIKEVAKVVTSKSSERIRNPLIESQVPKEKKNKQKKNNMLLLKAMNIDQFLSKIHESTAN